MSSTWLSDLRFPFTFHSFTGSVTVRQTSDPSLDHIDYFAGTPATLEPNGNLNMNKSGSRSKAQSPILPRAMVHALPFTNTFLAGDVANGLTEEGVLTVMGKL